VNATGSTSSPSSTTGNTNMTAGSTTAPGR
jgi:hypothetical protein